MMITATELKLNLGKYLKLAKSEDIYISKNGKSIVKLTSVEDDKISMLDSLTGIFPYEHTTTDGNTEEQVEQA